MKHKKPTWLRVGVLLGTIGVLSWLVWRILLQSTDDALAGHGDALESVGGGLD
jgi:hypothetical protein